jgi:hypothetical protein
VQNVITPDLKGVAEGKGAKTSPNLSLMWIDDVMGKPALKVQPTKQEFAVEDKWIVLLNGIAFTNGVIEFDALGQSAPPQSNFLGIAFHAVDDGTHDAIYFRPFNFRAEDRERKIHAVQYVSHPDYPWFDLRKEKPGKYEQPIDPAPDGDAWFHARIVVEWPRVRVYVNAAKEPSLVVDALSDRKDKGIGLWVGPGKGGYFANLTIKPAS